METAELSSFAEGVAAAAKAHPAAGAWRPDAPCDDRAPGLLDALAALGWDESAADPELVGAAGAGGVALGRALAPLDAVDRLLGGSPLAGALVRYAGVGDEAMLALGPERLVRVRIVTAEPCAYGDALAVQRVERSELGGELDPAEAAARLGAWTAASTGYLAGLADGALALARDHVLGREAFGAPLAALAPVQQRLADAATRTQGLLLLAHEPPSAAALAWAGEAACAVAADCHQLLGALGFTLEHPLQRCSRRARALGLWNEAVLDGAAAAQ
jgi:hypothetical protein